MEEPHTPSSPPPLSPQPPPPPPLVSEPPPEAQAPAPPRTSLAAKLLNVFAAPGDVFQEVKTTAGSAANWVVPAILLAITGAISAVIVMSQPAIQQKLREQIRDQQAKAMDKQVEAGKMTRQQADQALEVMEKFTGPTMLKIFGGIGAVIGSFGRVICWGLVLWLMGKWFLKTQFSFAKALEVAGLALMISVLGTIVSMLLTVNLEKMGASPSLALVVRDFDMTRKSHLFLAAANVFYFWQVAVVSLGLARLAGVPFVRAALPVFAWWLLWESFLISTGMGSMALG